MNATRGEPPVSRKATNDSWNETEGTTSSRNKRRGKEMFPEKR